jgi:N6-L-threonylcarbamoyladenine synthase
VRAEAESMPVPLDPKEIADLAASFQAALVESIVDRTRRAIREFRADHPDGTALVASGGVAANTALRTALVGLARDHRLTFVAPPPALCTDNAVMIAWAGVERLKRGLTDPLDFKARPRWPLDPSAEPVRGAGVKA